MKTTQPLTLWIEPEDKEAVIKASKDARESLSTFAKKAVLIRAGVIKKDF